MIRHSSKFSYINSQKLNFVLRVFVIWTQKMYIKIVTSHKIYIKYINKFM